MSKIPLQLYVNEKYNDNASGYINRCHHDKSEKHRSDAYDGRQPTFRQLLHSYTKSDFCVGSQTIFKNYLRDHQESIEGYYNLQKQQKDILRLCKEKIAKKFPAQLVANLADEDVIRALKIAQNSDSNEIEKYCSSDHLVDAILQFITSNEEQKRTKKSFYKKSCMPTKSVSQCTDIEPKCKTKGSSPLKRIFGVFKKNKCPQGKFIPKQEFNYLVDENKCLYPPDTNEGIKVEAAKSDYAIDTDADLSPRRNRTLVASHNYSPRSTSRNKMPTNGKIVPAYQPDSTVGKCTCHSQVKKITDDIKRQEGQIKEIQTTLQDCLAILKRIDHPSLAYEHNLFEKPMYPKKTLLANTLSNLRGRTEFQYRVKTSTNDKKINTKNKKKLKARKSDVPSTDMQQKRVCCYKCKRKKKKSDKTTLPDNLTVGTSTSHSEEIEGKWKMQPTPPPVETSAVKKESPVTTDISSFNTETPDDADANEKNHLQSLTKKDRKKLRREKRYLKREKKRQQQLVKSTAHRKRCCLSRLIKFVCCSGCCT